MKITFTWEGKKVAVEADDMSVSLAGDGRFRVSLRNVQRVAGLDLTAAGVSNVTFTVDQMPSIQA